MSIGPPQKDDLMVRLGLPDLLRAMGCRSIDRVPNNIREQAENVLGEAGDMIRAQCVYTVHPIARMTETQIDLAECPAGPMSEVMRERRAAAAADDGTSEDDTADGDDAVVVEVEEVEQ